LDARDLEPFQSVPPQKEASSVIRFPDGRIARGGGKYKYMQTGDPPAGDPVACHPDVELLMKRRLVVGTSGRLRVLVVEDEPDFANQLTRILERKFSADVTVAPDVRSARERISDGEFQIITLDYQLPDGDGLTLIAEIVDGLENPPPLIMVTGHGSEETAAAAFDLGAAGYVAKGETLPGMLVEAIKNVLPETDL
jgi:CheY-like chemotaxis protein